MNEKLIIFFIMVKNLYNRRDVEVVQLEKTNFSIFSYFLSSMDGRRKYDTTHSLLCNF
jgi:hypothetical protein